MSIWKKGEDLFVLDSINREDIIKAEQKLGVKLPEEYKKLVLEQNGGIIKYNAHPSPIPTNWAEDYVIVDSIFGIGEDGILSSSYYIKEWGLPNDLVLLNGDDHIWIALDYRKVKTNPPVIFIDTEANQIVELADDFKSFLRGLFVVENEILDIDSETIPYYDEKYIHDNIHNFDLIQLIDLVNVIPMALNQQFVFEIYLKLMKNPNVELREAIAFQICNLIINNIEISEVKLLKEIVHELSNDDTVNIRDISSVIRESIK